MTMNNSKAFQLKGSLFTLTILQLYSFDVDLFKQQLTETIEKAPNFFENAPIVIDLHRLQNIQCPIDFAGLIEAIKQHGMLPVGTLGGSHAQQQQAIDAGLGTFPAQYAIKKPAEEKPQTDHKDNTKPREETKESVKSTTKIITQPVRSGQQIYANGSDLIVLSSVGHGAELIADGNIHVYGVLRGRALAGVSGDTTARIFCHKLDAELVSIAGLYQLSEKFSEKYPQEHLQIFMKDKKLHISSIY